jgi:ribose transport system permease protein
MSVLRVRLTPTTGLLVAIVALAAYAMVISSGNFLTAATMSTLTPLLSVYVIVALGQGLVIGTGGIDLSVPYTMTLVGSIILYVCSGDASKAGRAIAISIAVCWVIGTVNGVLVETFGLNALVATLSVGMVVAGLTRLYRGPVDTQTSLPEGMQTWARANVAGLSLLLVVVVVLIAGITVVTDRTVRGRRLVASSTSARAAFLLGLWARSYRVLAYCFASVLYGIGAICLSGLLGSPDLSLGTAFQLAPIVAVVIGGAALSGARINYVATALGAVFLMLFDYELKIADFPSGVSMLVQGLVLAAGLSTIYVVQRRSVTKTSGNGAGQPEPRSLGEAPSR